MWPGSGRKRDWLPSERQRGKVECGSREEQPPFRPTAALGDGLDKRAGFPISPTHRGQKTSPEHGCRGMADSDSAAFISGDRGSRTHPQRCRLAAGDAKEMAERKPRQLALERAETQRDLLQDIFCCFWMLGLSLWEEPTHLRSTCTLGEAEGWFFPPSWLAMGDGGTAGLQPQLARGGRSRLSNESLRVLSHQPVAVTPLVRPPAFRGGDGTPGQRRGRPNAFIKRRWHPGKEDSQPSPHRGQAGEEPCLWTDRRTPLPTWQRRTISE